jgi:hypothetical protein
MREFRIRGKKKDLVWRVWRDGADVHVEYGTLGGQLQHTFDTLRAVKEGTTAYLSPEANAIEEVLRRIRDKTEAGYYEVNPTTGVALEWTASGGEEPHAKMFNGLPKSLCWMKPRPQPKAGSREENAFLKVVDSGHDIVTVKRDGFMHPILITTSGDVKVYTRRMEPCTEKYPFLTRSLRKVKLPKRSVLLCEFVVAGPERDDRLKMQAISNSLPDRAVALQTAGDHVTAIVLSTPIWNGEDMTDLTFGQLIEFEEENFGVRSRCPDGFEGMEIVYGGFEAAKKEVKRRKLEGLVIYDANAVPGSRAYNFRGKPERPECWKWKPELEDDFLVVFDPDCANWSEGGSWGKGKHMKTAGRVALYQRDAEGCWVFISGCGSGFTDEERGKVVERAARRKGVAGVAEVKFTERRYIKQGDKTNSLVEPIFVRWSDKKPDEVTNQYL